MLKNFQKKNFKIIFCIFWKKKFCKILHSVKLLPIFPTETENPKFSNVGPSRIANIFMILKNRPKYSDQTALKLWNHFSFKIIIFNLSIKYKMKTIPHSEAGKMNAKISQTTAKGFQSIF